MRLGVWHLAVGADVDGVERVGEGTEAESEVVVDGIAPSQVPGGVKQRGVLRRIETAGAITVEGFGSSLHADRQAGRCVANRASAARAVLVRTEKPVEPVQPLAGLGEVRFVGDDVDRSGERVGSVHQRAGTVDDFHPRHGIRRHEPDLGAGPFRRLPGGIEPFAIHQDQQARRIQAAQARTHTERPAAHWRDVGRHGQRVAGGCLIGLFDRGAADRVDVQRDLPDFTLGARRRDDHRRCN